MSISNTSEQLFSEAISQIRDIPGVDRVYFINEAKEIIKEHSNNQTDNYLEQVRNILNSESLLKPVSNKLYEDEFHTYSFLNEEGLIVISRLSNSENLYMVVIAGENEPVDLLNLLKICKENRLNFQESSV